MRASWGRRLLPGLNPSRLLGVLVWDGRLCVWEVVEVVPGKNWHRLRAEGGILQCPSPIGPKAGAV